MFFAHVICPHDLNNCMHRFCYETNICERVFKLGTCLLTCRNGHGGLRGTSDVFRLLGTSASFYVWKGTLQVKFTLQYDFLRMFPEVLRLLFWLLVYERKFLSIHYSAIGLKGGLNEENRRDFLIWAMPRQMSMWRWIEIARIGHPLLHTGKENLTVKHCTGPFLNF